MPTKFELDDYYELLALWNATILAKFSTNLPKPELYTSPLLSSAIKKMQQTLADSDGHNWDFKVVEQDSPIYWRVVYNISKLYYVDHWNELEDKVRSEVIEIACIPYKCDDNIILHISDDISKYLEQSATLVVGSELWIRLQKATVKYHPSWNTYSKRIKREAIEQILVAFDIDNEIASAFIQAVDNLSE